MPNLAKLPHDYAFLMEPTDDAEITAAQVAYEAARKNWRTPVTRDRLLRELRDLRASKATQRKESSSPVSAVKSGKPPGGVARLFPFRRKNAKK